jgi:hypothetical protein
MVRDAVDSYKTLSDRGVRFIPQGSYHNNTNVRQESDVDICVCCTSTYFVDFGSADYGSVSGQIGSPYTFRELQGVEVGLGHSDSFG